MTRDALWEWWAGIRFAIDWSALARANNRKGHKCLCRFPKAVIRWKVQQLVIEWVAAQLLSGERNLLKTINTDAHWFALYESEYGLSFKHANRRYEVQEHVWKRRMEIFWWSLFKVRKFILLLKKYDPVLWNADQTPYYQNEVGAQNKPTLAVMGANVPIVEGKSAAHSRWTAMLSCCSSEEMIRKRWPWARLGCAR